MIHISRDDFFTLAHNLGGIVSDYAGAVLELSSQELLPVRSHFLIFVPKTSIKNILLQPYNSYWTRPRTQHTIRSTPVTWERCVIIEDTRELEQTLKNIHLSSASMHAKHT